MLTSIKAALAKQIMLPLQSLGSTLTESEVVQLLELPKQREHGQLAFPVFSLAKALRKAPPVIAGELAKAFTASREIKSVNPMGGFLNFVLSEDFLQETLLNSIRADASRLGYSSIGRGKTMVIDYSSPNIAKPMSIGHLRATVIGQAIKNLAETQGYKVIGINHLGDWGSQFGKLVYAYLTFGHEYDFESKPFESLYRIYVRFHDEAENDPTLEKKGAEIFKRLEDGDPEIRKIWEKFRLISIQEYERVYELLGVKFDLVQGEAYYNEHLGPTVERIRKAGILEESQGAQVVFVGEDKPPCIILKADGASLYATRDIASAIYRHEVLKGDEIVYVTGAEQTLHFTQVFSVLKKMGYSWADNCHHIGFGLYRFKDIGKMSTRKGNVIFAEDVLERAITNVREIIQQKNPELEDKESVAKTVGIGAIVFNDLVNDKVKNIEFDWERVLDFEGDSGPYLQYCVVRCKSIERKNGTTIELEFPKKLEALEEQSLMMSLMMLPEILSAAHRNFKPNLLAGYLLDVCRDFNHFYHKHKVIQEPDEGLRQSRLALVKCTQLILEQGLRVLGMNAPDQM